MMEKYKISAVSYINTYPFLYGIDSKLDKNLFSLTTDVPSQCARKLIENEADIGLVPVGALPNLKKYFVISDYCIGAVGKVKTVILASKIPVDKIEKIYLDNESRTSVNLIKVLAKYYWKKDFKYEKITPETDIQSLDAVVLIGDKIFNLDNFEYRIDLAEEWLKFKNLPFVFAVWVSNKKLDDKFVNQFNAALKFGVENLNPALEKYLEKSDKEIYLDYLKNNISYNLDFDKKLAMSEFLAYLK